MLNTNSMALHYSAQTDLCSCTCTCTYTCT